MCVSVCVCVCDCLCECECVCVCVCVCLSIRYHIIWQRYPSPYSQQSLPLSSSSLAVRTASDERLGTGYLTYSPPNPPPQAIEFLSRQELLQTHAVHFAIALQDMELLHLTDSTQSKLRKDYTVPHSQASYPTMLVAFRFHNICLPPPPPPLVVKDPTGVRRLNFARLVIGYTRRFALTDPREALQYFYLLKVSRKLEEKVKMSGVML